MPPGWAMGWQPRPNPVPAFRLPVLPVSQTTPPPVVVTWPRWLIIRGVFYRAARKIFAFRLQQSSLSPSCALPPRGERSLPSTNRSEKGRLVQPPQAHPQVAVNHAAPVRSLQFSQVFQPACGHEKIRSSSGLVVRVYRRIASGPNERWARSEAACPCRPSLELERPILWALPELVWF